MPKDLKFNDLAHDASDHAFFGQAIDLLLLIQSGEVPHDPGIFTSRLSEVEDAGTIQAAGLAVAMASDALIGKIPGISIDSIEVVNESELSEGQLPVAISWSYES